MAEIIVAERAGACYGVERALNLTLEQADKAAGPVHTLGPLIHNPLVVEDLDARGVRVADCPADAGTGLLIIRAHGTTPEVIADAEARGLTVLDATCPYVKKVHVAAKKLVDAGYDVLVVGEAGHPEVEGILGHAGCARVVGSVADVRALISAGALGKKVGVVVQTTQTLALLQGVVDELLAAAQEVRVVNTICAATQERQQAAAELAAQVDAMMVIGGKNSGNTRRLFEICSERCGRTHHIESADELDAAWFAGTGKIGITAGASTPQAHIDAVVKRLHALA